MALTYLPPLPEGLHPFYCIYYNIYDSLTIVSYDKPLIKKNTNSGIDGFVCSTNQKWDEEKKEWIKGDETWGLAIAPNYNNRVIYTNEDISSVYGGVFAKKSPDATQINIKGGDVRNMQKGMVWNVGEAITLEPKEAPQVCTFSSSNSDVCTVDETGKIVAVGEGECIITITSKM
ncbi:hypothetical protein EQZ09_08890 [Clostridium perfringens]|nr:hypothetical protein [Clostridium perfringens]